MRRPARHLVAASCLVAAAAAGCSTDGHPGAAPAPARTFVTPPTADATGRAPSHTVWLCRPDRDPDPCTSDRASTAVLADGSRRADPQRTHHPDAADCFYVYPTVSREHGRNSDLRIEKPQRDVATAQAARFSGVCRVWAPMYRQRTVSDLFNLADLAPQSTPNRIAYRSLRDAWRDYLSHHNHGRPVVFIGHSQGAAMLIRLLHNEIDPVPALVRRVALAVLLGGNVTVPRGRTVGGSFDHLPLCTHSAQPGCVIAYSSFPGQPPPAAFFGRPGRGVSLLSGEAADTSLDVACVNPADVGGGRAPLHPYFPTALVNSGVLTPWTTYPDRYTAECRTGDGASWLQVTPTRTRDDVRPVLGEPLGALWGFHIADVNLALGDLVDDVAAAVRTWRRDVGHVDRHA